MILRYASAVFCGALFGLGLAVSQMSSPAKVIGFLDVAGDWDPSLLLVLGAAVAVTGSAFRFLARMPRPLFDDVFEKPKDGSIDTSLLAGAAAFGVGWGLSGYCPGPGVVALAKLAPDALIFVSMFFVGSALYRIGKPRANPRADRAAAPTSARAT